MKSLTKKFLEEFSKHWVVQKTKRRFSTILIDQAHEQHNALVKGEGGAIGLTENPTAFRRWMVVGPEMVRRLQAFECTLASSDKPTSLEDHKEGLSHQKAFQKHVCSLDTITSMGNPFCEDCPELVVTDTRDCADKSVAATVRTIVGRAKNINVICLPTKHLGAQKLVSTCSCAPDLTGIWECWRLRTGENRSNRRKTSWSKDEDQQQTRKSEEEHSMASLCKRVTKIGLFRFITLSRGMLFLCFSVRDRGVRIRRPRSSQCSKVTVHYSVDSIKPTSIAMET